MSATFGAVNNFVSGAFAGGSASKYSVAGGPYVNAIAALGNTISAVFNLYAHYDNGSGSIERHLVHTESLSNSKPFRLGNVDKGFLADQWEIDINCDNVRIHEATIATTMKELAGV